MIVLSLISVESFCGGQVYVALSRCRTFEGLVLTKPVTKPQLRLDYRVIKFITQIQYAISQKLFSTNDKISQLNDAIKNKISLKMIYLKAQDEKTRRTITPTRVYDSRRKAFHSLHLMPIVICEAQIACLISSGFLALGN